MTSATEGQAGGGGKPTEETTEVVAEEEPLQQPIRMEGKAQTDSSRGTTADVENPWQCDPSGREIIPLRMDDFPGQPTSPLPALSPPNERAYTEERVPRLEGPSRQEGLQIIELSSEAGTGEEEPRGEKKRKEQLLAQFKVRKDKRQKKEGSEKPAEKGRKKKKKTRATAEDAQPRNEMITVELDGEAILQLNRFDYPKLQEECNGRLTGGKRTKSGKLLHRTSLCDHGVKEQFLEYITGIGFEWLLEFGNNHVPIALAQEFFTTFQFKATTDVGGQSISFRIFQRNVSMSLTEWSVRLGLYLEEGARQGAWVGRDIGPPRSNGEYNPQAAWVSITHPQAPAYKATQSRGYHIKNPVLRLAQVYLGYNLLG